MIEFAKKLLDIEINAISKTKDNLNNDFNKAVDLILNISGKVIVIGMGKSGIISKKIAATFASTGTPSFFVHPAEAGHGDLGMIESKDIILILSNSGNTLEIRKLFPFFKYSNVKTISITSNPDSYIAKSSDIHLLTCIEKEACPLNLAPSASTTATLALGDALALTVSHLKGFKKKDYALVHPDGSLGEKLLYSIEKVMHKGKNIPIINENSDFNSIVNEITKKKFGFTLCKNNSDELSGIITDGDLRRSLQKHGVSVTKLKAIDIMHNSPKTIKKDETVSKAIEKMESNEITTLAIVNNKNKIIGIVHLHDLLGRGRLKIVL